MLDEQTYEINVQASRNSTLKMEQGPSRGEEAETAHGQVHQSDWQYLIEKKICTVHGQDRNVEVRGAEDEVQIDTGAVLDGFAEG